MVTIITILLTVFFGCKAPEKAAFGAVSFTTLDNYVLQPDVLFPENIQHKFISKESEFQSVFKASKTVPGSSRVPDFNTESVIAVILQPTEKVVSLDIDKVTVNNKEIKIDYTTTDTTKWRTYRQTTLKVATIPKNTTAIRAVFYENKIKRQTVAIRSQR